MKYKINFYNRDYIYYLTKNTIKEIREKKNKKKKEIIKEYLKLKRDKTKFELKFEVS